MWQKCPVCNGTGLVSRPPWVAGDVTGWSSTGTGPYPCRVCGGRGVLLAPDEYHATDPPRIEFDVPPPECKELKTRAERAEAKMRKLSEAAAWRDECFATILWFEWTTVSLTDQRRKANDEIIATESKARADYQAALKAIIEEFVTEEKEPRP